MKKKVLHLITGIELGGGAENMLLQLLPRMNKNLDNRVCVIRGRGEVGKKLEKRGIKVYYLDLKNVFDLGIIFRYKKVVRVFNPEIQINYLIHADLFGRLFGKIFGIKKIVPYIRNIHKKRKVLMFFDKITLSLADFILTNSEATKKHYIEKMGVRNKKIKCIPNAIDLKRFQNIAVNRKQKLKELGINSELVSLIVSVVARMEKQKGIPTIIKAFFEINKKHPQSFLLLIGHGKEKQNMIKLTSDLGIEKRVLFLEKRKDIPELLTLTDIFVLPSFNEGMSNALLEAMSLGKIIITSDIEENKELVRDGKNGLNFKAGDVRNLDKKLEYVINNHQTAKNLGKASLEKVKAKYKIEEVTKDYEKFLIEF